MVNLITRMDSMKIVWRVIHLWRFCGKISLKIASQYHGERFFYGDFMIKLM